MGKNKNTNHLYTIWSCVSHISGWLRFLWLTGQYTEAELNQLEQIDDDFLSIAREEESKWREWKRKELPKTAHDWLEVFPECEHLVPSLKRSERNFKKQLEVARSVELVGVAEQYVDLKRSGYQRLVGLCPFHDEKTPSFTIYTKDNHFYCFGCHHYGDVIDFIRWVEKPLKFKLAVKILYEYSQEI